MIACLPIAAAGQSTPPQPTFQSGIDVVQVDVSVLDKARQPVRGLTTADFTILEDGKPRPIVALVPVDLTEGAATAPGARWMRTVAPDVVTNAVPPEGRLVVIMFDWSIRFEDQALAKRIGRAVVDALGPNDLAAVTFSSGFANAGTPQNFTADRARLLTAINQPFAVALHNPHRGPLHDPRNANDVMIDDPEGYDSGDCLCRVCVPEAIGRIADTLRDVRGRRKTLIFIGTYFRSYENLQGPVTRQGGTGGFLQGPVMSPVRPGVCSSRLKDARENMLRSTSLANLTVHTLDPVGVETFGNSPLGGGSIAAIRERQDDLAVLADLTGGRTVMNTGAPEAQVPDVFAESHSYYLLAFAPANPRGNGDFHKIEVKVKRPGVSIRTRAGYYAGSTRTTALKFTGVAPETAAALGGVLPRTDLPLSLMVAPFEMPGKEEAAVAIVLGAEQSIHEDASGGDGQVKLVVAAFDRSGRSVQSEQQTVAVTRAPGISGRSVYEVVSRLALKPGRYEIRAALDDAHGKRASVYTYVDVPNFAKAPLSLSGVVLQAGAAAPAGFRDALADVVPVVPTSRRSFGHDERVTVFVRAYQGQDVTVEPVEVRADVQDTNGSTVFSGTATLAPDEFRATRAADFHFDLPLARLANGEFLLTVGAARGPASERREVRFSVR